MNITSQIHSVDVRKAQKNSEYLMRYKYTSISPVDEVKPRCTSVRQLPLHDWSPANR